jgi:hypothetical protein
VASYVLRYPPVQGALKAGAGVLSPAQDCCAPPGRRGVLLLFSPPLRIASTCPKRSQERLSANLGLLRTLEQENGT